MRLVVGVELGAVSYELAVGLPSVFAPSTPFALDGEIKEERVWLAAVRGRHGVLLDRAGASATARDCEGETVTFAVTLDRFEPAIAQLGEPGRFPELYDLREQMRRWRFYHSFPTDLSAPARQRRPGVRTPVLSDDGRDLAAAFATIEDLGQRSLLAAAVERAFPGAVLDVVGNNGTFEVEMSFGGLRRPLVAHDLSDGTLRYLYLVAALLTPRPPELLVLNEPETSLHPGLLGPLGDLIVDASRRSQVVVTTHSTELAEVLVDQGGARHVVLERGQDGATTVVA